MQFLEVKQKINKNVDRIMFYEKWFLINQKIRIKKDYFVLSLEI